MTQLVERARTEAIQLGHNYIGTEHVLLAVSDANPKLLAPYGISIADVRAGVMAEITRIVDERAAAKPFVDNMRQSAQQQFGVTASPAYVMGSPTPRLASILDAAASDQDDDVLAAIIDEDSNLAVIVLERLGVPLDALRASLSDQ
jgi:ATP-dependent Clp protease ATP-binding subunit ClpA